MNQTVISGDIRRIPRFQTDVVIVGCGVAGLYAALNLDPHLNCTILNKAGKDISNSMYAQGGIAAVMPLAEADLTLHIKDTMAAGAGWCDQEAVEILVAEAADNIDQLIALGVPFDMEKGELSRTHEGGHTVRRILHCGGDATGLHITTALLQQAKRRGNIEICDDVLLIDILYDTLGVTGVLVFYGGEPIIFETRRVILATGGIGRSYHASTNAICATGDGMAAAQRVGVALKHMEFVQFHPTAFWSGKTTDRSFLISESMRGEGARLINSRGEPFMQGIHPLADLAPRDIVARAIFSELQRTGAETVFLDISFRSQKYLQKRFPTIYAECMRQGCDIAATPIPVRPAQHYMMGGILTGLHGETALPGLYACGETACTGVHGANRLASNSLLECLVFGRRAAFHCANLVLPSAVALLEAVEHGTKRLNYRKIQNEIRNIMSKYCGIIRTEQGLIKAIARLTELEEYLLVNEIQTPEAVETLNLAQVAGKVASAAAARKISVGAHYRSDDKEEERCKLTV